MEELLVAIACISSKGCSQTVHLYYIYNPKIETYINQNTIKAATYIGKDVIKLAPIAFIISGGSGSVRLNKYFSLDINREEKFVSFKYDF